MPSDVVRLTRRVSFSSGHRYWLESLSPDENRALFGPWASPYNHGHNYVLDVTVEGVIEPTTAMVVNIKDVDDCLQRHIVARFEGKSINDEVEGFRDRASCIENLLLYFADLLRQPGVLPTQVELIHLRLQETATLSGAWHQDGTMNLTRSYEFAASHRLHVPSLSEEENVRLFGKCNNAAGHGHNYRVEVTVKGEPDPQTGMIIDLMALDQIVDAEIVDRYDHKNLNCDLPEFEGRVTTTEALVTEIFKRLKAKLPVNLHSVRLWETDRSSFEVVSR